MYTTLISTEDLFAVLGSPGLVIVDCRFSLAQTELGQQEYGSGHIPGAVYAHLDRDLSGPIYPDARDGILSQTRASSSHAFARGASRNDSQVVAYDDLNGAIAARLWWMLKWLGHEAVALLDGGWSRWTEEGYSIERLVPAVREGKFEGHPKNELLARLEQVEEARSETTFRLLDARAADRFRGENETIDPVAGHIPGAISVPYSENLNSGGLFKGPEELRKIYESILRNSPVERVICYCGSGVTAAHDLVAMAHAGLGLGRLYVGSWSEWITDPSRPTATGDRQETPK